MTRFRNIFSLIAIAALAGLLAACGGSGGEVSADDDPKAVLEKAFSKEAAVNSAKIDAVTTIEIEGDEAGTIEATVNGAVENANQQAPDMDLTLSLDGEVDGESVEFEAGAVMTADEGVVRLNGENYMIDPGMYEQIRGQISQQAGNDNADSGGLFGSLDAQAFLTDVKNDGNEEVEGVETVKISGTVDTDKALAEFESFLDSADTLQGLGVEAPGSNEIEELRDSLGNVDFSIYVGSDDGVIRKMDFSAPVDPSDSDSSGSFSVSITLADVNEPQDITPPADTKPFDELIAAIGSGALSGLGIDGFNDLGQLGGGGSGPFDRLSDLLDGSGKAGKSGGSGGNGAAGSGDSNGASGAKAQLEDALSEVEAQVNEAMEGMPDMDKAKEALDCIQKAKTVDEITACEELVK